jgi:hypothetical protein
VSPGHECCEPTHSADSAAVRCVDDESPGLHASCVASRWVRMTAVCIFACLSSAACNSDSRSSTPTTRAPLSTVTTEESTSLTSPGLTISINPTKGGPGTAVAVDVTGCNDRSGLNHAVSFNNNSQDFAARNDRNTVQAVPTVQHGETLTGTYTIRVADHTGGIGAFFAQCGETLKTAVFNVLAP